MTAPAPAKTSAKVPTASAAAERAKGERDAFAQPGRHHLERDYEAALELGQDDGARRHRASAQRIDPEVGRDCGVRLLGQDADRLRELALAEALPDQLPHRARRASDRERPHRQRHGMAVQLALHLGGRRCDRLLPWRVVRDETRRQAQGPDVDRPQPDGLVTRQAERDLRGAAADVADGDAAAEPLAPGERPLPGEPGFLVRGQDLHALPRGPIETSDQLGSVPGLPAGRGDDDREPRTAKLAGLRREGGDGRGRLLDLRGRDRAAERDLRAQADQGLALADGLHTGAVRLGDEQADRIRPHIDDCDSHPERFSRSGRSARGSLTVAIR
jgi:hypothetical protein